jgi:hypothetical protein
MGLKESLVIHDSIQCIFCESHPGVGSPGKFGPVTWSNETIMWAEVQHWGLREPKALYDERIPGNAVDKESDNCKTNCKDKLEDKTDN